MKQDKLDVLEKAFICSDVYENSIDEYLESIEEKKYIIHHSELYIFNNITFGGMGSYILKLPYNYIKEKWNLNKNYFINEDNGFYSALYFNNRTKKYIIAFRGTEGKKRLNGKINEEAVKDWNKGNIPQIFGLTSSQYLSALSLVTEMEKRNIDFEMTGHSLGGGLAAAATMLTKTKGTITFNSAGLHKNTVNKYLNKKLNYKKGKKLITNYFVQGEAVTMAQRFGKLFLTILAPIFGPLAYFILPNAIGRFVKIKCYNKKKTPIQRHQMSQVIENLIIS